MSDLSSLFSTTFSRTLPSTSQPSQSYLRATVPTASLQSWRLSDLQSSLRKSVRTQVDCSALQQQLHDFQCIQQRQFLNKSISCIAIALICTILFQFDTRITFHLILFLMADLLLHTPFKLLQETLICTILRATKPLLYAALVYYLLKFLSGADMDSINYPLTFASLLLTVIYGTLDYLDPVFKLATESAILKNINQRGILQKLSVLPVLLLQRIKFIKEMHFYLGSMTIAAILLMVGLTLCLSSLDVMTFFLPLNLIYSLAIWLSLEGIMLVSRVIAQCWVKPITIVRDKMPIFLTLLRLPYTPFAAKVQNICMINLYLKMQKITCFLSTETCKSLLFPTYMDLFNQYAQSTLESLNSRLSQQLLALEKLQRTISSQKSMIQDLFIFLRKIQAVFLQIRESIRVFQIMVEGSCLLQVAALADEQAYREKDTMRVSPRGVELMDMIREKVRRLKSRMGARDSLKRGLQAYENRLEGWLASIRQGWI